MDLCESPEDLLGAVHERWEEIQKIRFCQVLLNQPPVSIRNQVGDIARLDGTLLRDLLESVDNTTQRQALEGPPSANGKWSAWDSLVEILCLDARTPFQERPPVESEARDCRGAQAVVMEQIAKAVSQMDHPLRFPQVWIVASCLDRRFEAEGRWALDDRVIQHLLNWPNPSDVLDAMRGLSLQNQEILLKGMPPARADAQRVKLNTGSEWIPWGRILKAQRRLSHWLPFAYLRP